MNPWNTGLTVQITIANTGSTAIDGWTLDFALPGGQRITNGWGATYAPDSGTVTARNVDYTARIAAGSSVQIGLQATHNGNLGAATSFRLNGTTCTATP